MSWPSAATCSATPRPSSTAVCKTFLRGEFGSLRLVAHLDPALPAVRTPAGFRARPRLGLGLALCLPGALCRTRVVVSGGSFYDAFGHSRPRPGRSILAGLIATLLTPVLLVLLCVTVIGIAAIPFVAFGLICVGLFGKAVMLAWLGGRIAGRSGVGAIGHPAVAVLIGGVLVLVLYVVPVLGFLVYKVLGFLGLGAVVYTVILDSQAIRAAKSAPASASPHSCCAAQQRSTGVHGCCRRHRHRSRSRRCSRCRTRRGSTGSTCRCGARRRRSAFIRQRRIAPRRLLDAHGSAADRCAAGGRSPACVGLPSP